MELPSLILEQIAFNTRAKMEKRLVTVTDYSTQKRIYLNRYKLSTNNLKSQ